MNAVERHPYWSLAVVAALTSIVHSMDYEDQLRIARQSAVRYVEQPAMLCRLPDPLTEMRVIVETRDDAGRIDRRCYVEPRQDERPADTMKRLISRERTRL